MIIGCEFLNRHIHGSLGERFGLSDTGQRRMRFNVDKATTNDLLREASLVAGRAGCNYRSDQETLGGCEERPTEAGSQKTSWSHCGWPEATV